MGDFQSGFSIEFIISIVFNIFLLLLLILFYLSNRSKIKRLNNKYNRFMTGLSDRNIEELMDSIITMLEEIKNKDKEIEVHLNHIERNLAQCMQKVGVVRFNAFDNVGSDLSFSIALLDSYDNGFVISGIYSRDSSLTYAKPITAGNSKYSLSAEEIQAIDIAKKSSFERIFKAK